MYAVMYAVLYIGFIFYVDRNEYWSVERTHNVPRFNKKIRILIFKKYAFNYEKILI